MAFYIGVREKDHVFYTFYHAKKKTFYVFYWVFYRILRILRVFFIFYRAKKKTIFYVKCHLGAHHTIAQFLAHWGGVACRLSIFFQLVATQRAHMINAIATLQANLFSRSSSIFIQCPRTWWRITRPRLLLLLSEPVL